MRFIISRHNREARARQQIRIKQTRSHDQHNDPKNIWGKKYMILHYIILYITNEIKCTCIIFVSINIIINSSMIKV